MEWAERCSLAKFVIIPKTYRSSKSRSISVISVLESRPFNVNEGTIQNCPLWTVDNHRKTSVEWLKTFTHLRWFTFEMMMMMMMRYLSLYNITPNKICTNGRWHVNGERHKTEWVTCLKPKVNVSMIIWFCKFAFCPDCCEMTYNPSACVIRALRWCYFMRTFTLSLNGLIP